LVAAFALAALASLPAGADAQALSYRLDPVHTRVLLAIDHAGYSTALGTVSGSTGVLAFDPADWSSARVDASVPLDRVDFGDAAWNRAAARMLGSARYPAARFISASVQPVDAHHARACGTLYMHGAAVPTCLDIRFNQLKRESLPPFHDTAGFSATTTLQRSDFGIDAWRGLVGDQVELRMEVEAVRDDAAPAPAPTLPAGPP
jgi:polyisoprenoid-binding protein YceI